MSIRRNTFYNLLGAGLPLAVSLITIPVYLGLVGEARYGVLAIAWLLLGYFGLFDLGLGRATAQRVAALRDGSAADRAQVFWTAFTMNLGLGIAGGLLVWPIADYFFAHVFQVEESLRPEVQAAVPWLMLGVPMAILTGVLTGALQGRERFLELNVISVSGTVLFQLLPLAAAMAWGADLGVLLPAALGARLFTVLALFGRCRAHLLHGHGFAFARTQAGVLLRFGGWVTVTSLIGPMMVSLDRMIIGAVSGAKAVTYYTVPFQLGERSTLVASALASAVYPRFASVSIAEERRIALQGVQALVVVMTPLVCAGVLLMGPFLSWWLDPEFSRQSALLGLILLLGFWVNSFAYIPYAQLQARGHPDLVAKCHLAELIPYFGLLFIGLQTLGLVGAAIAFSLRVLVDFMLLAGMAGVLRSSLRLLRIPVVLLAGAAAIATQVEAGVSGWFVLVGMQLAVTLVWAWWQAPASMKEVVSGSVGALGRRILKGKT